MFDYKTGWKNLLAYNMTTGWDDVLLIMGDINIDLLPHYHATRTVQYKNMLNWDQFSFLGNRARYEFIELDMSTGLDLSIPSSRPLTFPGGQSKNGYRAR